MIDLTILTITAREDPMFEDMAKSIHAAVANTNMKCEWLIIDAKLWYPHLTEPRRGQVAPFATDKLPIVHAPPKPSQWHGPHRTTDKDLPDTNGARNTGLIYARGDYLYLLDDCGVVSPGCFANLEKYRLGGIAVTHWFEKGDIHAPFKSQSGGSPGICEPTAFRGSAVGYPMDWLIRVNGWDESFAGKRSGNDLEITIRAHRAGMPCWADFTEGVIEAAHDLLFDASAFWTQTNDDKVSSLLGSDKIQSGNPYSIETERMKNVNHNC